VYSSRLALARTPLLVADLVHGDAGIAARLSLCAMGSFRFGGWPAKAGTQELLAGVAGHAARLRVAVLHPLLLRGELGARWRSQCGHHREGYQIIFHRVSTPTGIARLIRRDVKSGLGGRKLVHVP